MHTRASDEDYDHEVEANLTDEEQYEFNLISQAWHRHPCCCCDTRKVAGLIRVLFGKLKLGFLPYFDKVFMAFAAMLVCCCVDMRARVTSGSNPRGRSLTSSGGFACLTTSLSSRARCDVDPCNCIAAQCPQVSLKYREHFLDALLRYVADESSEVRQVCRATCGAPVSGVQAAVYGVGMMGQHGGVEYATIVKDVLPLLIQIINAPDSRSSSNIDATENTISALLKICRSAGIFTAVPADACSNPVFGIGEEQFVPLLMEWLPVTQDDEEAEYIYDYLCELVERCAAAWHHV